MSVEAGIGYWSTLSTDELEETRRSLQKDLDSGYDRDGDTKLWIGEIDQVLESREQSK